MDFVRYWAEKTDIAAIHLVCWLQLAPSQFYDWKKRYGKMKPDEALPILVEKTCDALANIM